MTTYAFEHPDEAIDALAKCLSIVHEPERIPTSRCDGRVLASDIVADRDSPAADVSAMDGYALTASDFCRGDEIPVAGESAAGSAAPKLVVGSAVRIFTGAVVPAGTHVVIKREDTIETERSIVLTKAARSTPAGAHIRRAGENSKAGSVVAHAGAVVHPPMRATLANFSCAAVDVLRRVKVALITTGNEVVGDATIPLQAWQLRNSNRDAIVAMLAYRPAIDLAMIEHVGDDENQLRSTIKKAAKACDAVVLTGGVSMGDHDYVPAAVAECGGKTVFHRLPIRPGKPILGAVIADQTLILGLPGNPVSAVVGMARFGLPLLSFQSGATTWSPLRQRVRVHWDDSAVLPLHWMRLVKLDENGKAFYVKNRGSGDLVSLAASDGFVEIPIGESGAGPWPYWPWS